MNEEMIALAEWYRACLDERERVARATLTSSSGSWHVDARGEVRDSDGIGVIHASARMMPVDIKHIALNDPTLVLAQVAAERRVLDAVPDWLPAKADDDEPEYAYGYGRAWHEAVQLLALSCADWPGYREEWRP